MLGVECDFSRRDSYVYAERSATRTALQREAEVAADLGLLASYVEQTDLPYPVAGAVRFTEQAQFHPRRWLLALAQYLPGDGSYLLTGTRAIGLREGDPCVVETTAGPISARDVLVTTHYPIFDRGLIFARLEPRRDLVVAAALNPQQAPAGMYISTEDHHSVRTTPYQDGKVLLIVGGEGYRTGEQAAVQTRYQRLADWAVEQFGVTELAYRWSAQDNTTLDRLPYIGRFHPGANHVWVATGFGLWGMTNGTLAGLLLRDLVTRVDNPWTRLYDPNRLTLRQSAPSFLKGNSKVAAHFLGDRISALSAPKPADLAPGQATVTRIGNRLVAIYRDPTGKTSALSARCTHLGCLVAFNDAEKSWDYPCHGSRFSLDGSVLQGPAIQPLKPIDVENNE